MASLLSYKIDMRDKLFVTLYPECGNAEVVKDVGMIPYYIGKNKKWLGIMACSNIDSSGKFIKKMKDFKFYDLQPKIHPILQGSLYLLKMSKRINVLNLYHYERRNLLWIILYKTLNPDGITYVKMDMGYDTLEKCMTNKKIYNILKRLFNHADVVSVESKLFQKKLGELFNKKIVYVPNGYVEHNFLGLKKENIIFTAARLGTKQKATEVLLEAFKKTYTEHNYDLYLAGGIEKDFQIYIEKYFQDYPELKQRVFFLGEIKDRNELMSYYEKAKIFILTSRWEGFPLVISEAISYGCYLLLTDSIPPSSDVIQSEHDGLIMTTDDVNDIAQKISLATKIYDKYVNYKEIIENGKKYEWTNISRNILLEIEK